MDSFNITCVYVICTNIYLTIKFARAIVPIILFTVGIGGVAVVVAAAATALLLALGRALLELLLEVFLELLQFLSLQDPGFTYVSTLRTYLRTFCSSWSSPILATSRQHHGNLAAI